MTKKDYILITGVLKNYVEAAESLAEVLQIQSLVSAFADALADDNERFDKSKFLNAIYKDHLRLGVHCHNSLSR